MIYLPLDKLLEQRSPQRVLSRYAADDPNGGRQRSGRCRSALAEGALMNRTVFQVVIALWSCSGSRAPRCSRSTKRSLRSSRGSRRSSRPTSSPACTSWFRGSSRSRNSTARVLTRNYPAEQFLTSEGKILNVDFYVKWRISDVERYYLATNGDEESAASRLAEIVKDGLKGVIAKRTIQQVVAAERSEFIGDILQFAGRSVNQLGLTLVDVRVKRIDLPDEVSESVYNRMRQNFRAPGLAAARRGRRAGAAIRAEAERARTEVLAEGNRDAEVIRARAMRRRPPPTRPPTSATRSFTRCTGASRPTASRSGCRTTCS
jgi:hypothetical protein